MRSPVNRSSVSIPAFRFAALMLAGLLLLQGCWQEKPPAHSFGHKHKHVGAQEKNHLLYQEPDRYTWQYPEKVIASLDLKPGMKVADLGAGTGYFTFRLAESVGEKGTVYAIDIEQEMIDSIDRQAITKQADNVKTVKAVEHDPLIPEKVDLIISVNVYHHLQDRSQYFKNAARYLKPGGRVAIIDFRKGAFRHFTERNVLLHEFKAAGYAVDKMEGYLPRQNFLIFKPGDQP